MGFFRIIARSLRQHIMSTLLAVFSIMMGAAMLVAVFNLQTQAEAKFEATGSGVDAVLAPKGSPLQIVLSAVYNLDDMPGEIDWSYVQKVRASDIVADAVCFVKGHSFAGFHVNAVEKRFFTEFEYEPGKKFSFDEARGGQGRCFEKRLEAVCGSEVARALGVRIGDSFNPVCGLSEKSPTHNDRVTFVGITSPTGTPYDFSVYIPLETVYTLDGHSDRSHEMVSDLGSRTVSGAYVRLNRINVSGQTMLHPGLHDLKYQIAQTDFAQLVVPTEELPRLFNIIGWITNVLTGISVLVIVMAGLFLFVSMYWALRERRRNIALMRALGATRGTVFALIMAEAFVISLLGVLLGVLVAHGLLAVGVDLIYAETGVMLSAWKISLMDFLVIPGAVVLGLLTGVIPAVQAYRLGVLRNLVPVS